MFAQETHEYIRDHIKFADQKAAFLFTTGSAILALLYSRSFQSQWIAAPTDPSSILSFAAMSCLTLAAVFAGSVVAPRRHGSLGGYIVLASIANYKSSSDYVAAITALSEDDLVVAKLHHCYELARICSRKYAALDRGLWFRAIGAGASMLCLLLP